MKLTLGFSPCPNDTFIFDALVNNKIHHKGVEFEPVLQDVQTLNEWAIEGKLDISKISYGVLPIVHPGYVLLNAGSALGKGVGPLLVSRTPLSNAEINGAVIGVPGKNTTAHLLLTHAFPGAVKKRFMIFSEIENAILDGTIDAGVIIHENRFTYEERGLTKLMDLGEYWEKQTKSPVPLGGIIMSNTYDKRIQNKVNSLIRKSVGYAFSNLPVIPDYVKQHSQEMDEKVMRQHIDLYVNDYTLGLGKKGRSAVKKLLEIYERMERK